MTDIATTAAPTAADYAADYPALLPAVRATFEARTAGARVLFQTDAPDLWTRYLDGFTADRQTYVCSACRQFVERYGGLATITEGGARVSAVWDAHTAPAAFRPVVAVLADVVARAEVVGVVRFAAPVLGTPATGDWRHLSATATGALLHTDRVHTPGQWAAEVRENVGTVARALEEFAPVALDEALRVLHADALSRAERFVGPVQWLRDLHTARGGAKDSRRRDAMLWRAVATAPIGYSHPRASVVGPLLEMVAAGEPYETIRRKWNAMTHPLQYQRPQAAPSAGNIAAAERIVETLGVARSLERRFARLDECQASWRPTTPAIEPSAASGGVFGGIVPKGASGSQGTVPAVSLPAQTMTWDKFVRVVLPTAERMDLLVPARGNFTALVTAAHLDAPPIIRWDRDAARNPVTAYVYHGGSSADTWQLKALTWHPVTAVVPQPNLWGDMPQPEHGDGVVLVLAGAVDTRTDQGNALFPETLRNELHAARATIEAYARRATLTGREEASACGVGLSKGSAVAALRVHVGGRTTDYRIDRWD